MSVDKTPGPVHVGDAARRVLERLKRTACQLAEQEARQYDCTICNDTGVVKKGKRSGICKCQQQSTGGKKSDRFF